MRKVIFDSSSPAAATIPELPTTLDTQDLIKLLLYFREITSADKHNGYNLCRDVNREAVRILKAQGFKAESLMTCELASTTRNRGSLSEHFVGVVKIGVSWHYFDATTDQLAAAIELSRPIYISDGYENIDDIIVELTETYMCNWCYDTIF